MNRIFLFVTIGLTLSCSPQTNQIKSTGGKVGETVAIEDKNIDWEGFDSSSTISEKEIKIQDLQGIWSAYKGVYRFGNIVNGMELTKPFIIEVKDNTYRRNSNGTFDKFILKDNFLIKTEAMKIDTGIINKITLAELTITWKDNANYTRYYYKK